MGGSTVDDFVESATGVVSDGVGVATGGVVDIENGKINTNVKDAAGNWVQSATGGDTMKSLMPEPPAMPKAENAAAQRAKAEAEAAAKLTKEVGERGKGLSSTVLGGSISEDASVLKKRKLLGE